MCNTVWTSEYFCGNKISDYGLENGYIDYSTLAKSFDCVLNNNIMQATCKIGYWEQENGIIDNSEEIEELQDKIYELEELEEIEEVQAQIEELQAQIEELEEEQDEYCEIFQYYIISDNGARILEEYTDEIVFYNEELDMYVWGVTHWGTSWDYVLTDIKIKPNNK